MNEIKENLIKELNQNETVVIATSGGPDSMALLHLVISLKEKLNLKIVCAHVNHKLRAESEQEEIMVKDFCTKNDVICEILTIEGYNKTNIENQARTKRYQFFEKCVKKCQANHLLTAHHGDDLIETILMRLTRGSNFKGYLGFEEKIIKNDYIIYRPLITITKQELLDYCISKKIPYAIDKTNDEDTYTRNRYRKYILPKLKKENKNVHQKFYKFSNLIKQYDSYITNQTNKAFKQVSFNNIINLDKLKNYDQLIQLKIIEKLLFTIYQKDITLINDKHTDLILKMINNHKPNQIINLPNNIVAIKTYNELKLIPNKNIKAYKKELKQKTSLPNGKQIIIAKSSTDNSNYTIYLNTKELNLPLFIRTKQPGDKIKLKGLNGTKKVKDIFINEKIPINQRKLWPILIDSDDNIIWIPGLKKSKFCHQKEENYDIILKYI